MLFFYKFFTFSQLPNKFYITKFTTTHTSAPTENPPPPTHQHPQKIHHYPHKIHQHTTQKLLKRHHPHHHNNNNKKSEIKERKQIGDEIDLKEKIDRWVANDEIDLEEEMIWPKGGRDRSSSGKLLVARSWRHKVNYVISPACLVALSWRLSLSLFARLSSKMVWNENRNLKQFLGQNLYFTVKWNVFPENSIFHAQPNTRWGVKWFLEMVWSQNKRTLSSIFNPYM